MISLGLGLSVDLLGAVGGLLGGLLNAVLGLLG